MSQDEVATLVTFNAYRDVMSGLVSHHGGRVVDAVGDNLLAEFPSVVDAVTCAAAIQRDLGGRGRDVPPERKMQFRIGVHLGDVVVEGDMVAGDGVNIAARLEGIAEPGGVCISGAAYEQVRDRLPEQYDDLGEQTLKNIARPVRAFQMRLRGDPATDATDAEKAPTGSSVVPGFEGRPAIAVLAFDNMSQDPEQEYFADGIAEDLITQLSAARRFPVIARNSSFTYRGKATDVTQVGRELGARYVVEGSVRRAGDRVRVTAQLIDATTGHHIWAERYDRKLEDIFALQDEITGTIIGAMLPGLHAFEWESASQRHPQSLRAWECLQRGMWHQNRLTREDNARALAFFQQALALEPRLAPASAALAVSHYMDVIFQWSDSPERSMREMMRAAQDGVAIDDKVALAQLALGAACSLTGERDRMVAALEKAVRYDPSLAMAHGMLGGYIAQLGRGDEGVKCVETAMRLSPRDPQMWVFLDGMAHAHFAAGRYEEARLWAGRCGGERPEYFLCRLIAAASLGHLGRFDEAQATLREGLQVQPDFSRELAKQIYSTAVPEFLDAFLDGLRKAGWDER
jgi:adenylate cyclase